MRTNGPRARGTAIYTTRSRTFLRTPCSCLGKRVALINEWLGVSICVSAFGVMDVSRLYIVSVTSRLVESKA
ncbi:hypothetical protein CC86DRAFT_29908 [Ophiobolus disseminans]|uniref:Uncharacterized protein n=1 Tax=Ophiobolus disseminans TaxID=1469910 RepID=A0A6A7A030_9PLEO|nr:hypothetical protein CC86DRAFT_29908 [Ophiobolus disseminans]